MKLKDLNTKYENVDIYVDRENFGMFEIPQKTKIDFAKTMFGERKVLFYEDRDNEKITEIIIESEDQYEKRQKSEN